MPPELLTMDVAIATPPDMFKAHDELLDLMARNMARTKQVIEYHAQLRANTADLEREGLERGKDHWKGNYLTLYYPQGNGCRKEVYVGRDPAAIARVRAGQARYRQWQSIQTAITQGVGCSEGGRAGSAASV